MAQGTNAAESDGPEISATATSDSAGNNLSLISISVPMKCKDNYLNNNNNEIIVPTITISKDCITESENNENPPAEVEASSKPAVAGAPALPEVKLPVSSSEDVVDSSRRHSKSSSLPHGVKLCPETGSAGPPSPDPVEEKWARMEEQLKQAHVELKEKDDEVEKLKGIRQQVEEELDDLTSSLFLEANKMVQEAKLKEISSEKSLREARMQLEGLQAEVMALKTLLITSTPSRPNLGGNGISTIFKKQHKRTPSHNHLQYGRSEDDPDGKEKSNDKSREPVFDPTRCEVDTVFHALFAEWRLEPTLSKEKAEFLQKIYREDISPCLEFRNPELASRLLKAIEENSIWVEPLAEKDKTNVPKECALLKVPRVCHYQMRFAFEAQECFDISQLCRDRIASVCEFLNYLRYIKNGLVKASVDDAYWEIIRLRKQMAMAKLGIPISS